MRPINDTLLVSVDSENTVDTSVLLVGRKRPNQSVEIINAFQGEDAIELYKLLTTVKKEGGGKMIKVSIRIVQTGIDARHKHLLL